MPQNRGSRALWGARRRVARSLRRRRGVERRKEDHDARKVSQHWLTDRWRGKNTRSINGKPHNLYEGCGALLKSGEDVSDANVAMRNDTGSLRLPCPAA
jgi:hypothetical protein